MQSSSLTNPLADSFPAGPENQPQTQLRVVALALALITMGGVLVAPQGVRQVALALIGVALGVTLYHTSFGFASAYRRLLTRGEVGGILAQLLMLAVATVLFAPVLASGSVFGRGVIGAIAPAGWQVATGAFLFGIGMQLGGGCGSGTLFGLGSGSTRLVVTLLGFVAGSFWASLHMNWWQDLPSLGTVALGSELGWPLAVIVQLVVLAILALGLRKWLGSRATPVARQSERHLIDLLRGPWPLAAGALLLAALNFLTLLVAGHPWSITWGFTLWGAKLATVFGWDPTTSAFWSGGFQQRAIEASVFADVTSVMNIGIILGALCAAALAGRFRPGPTGGIGPLLAAVVGGIAMGYGARIGFGCNIGAFFSGIASTSLHGWIWIAAAMPGCAVGIKLRSVFNLPN